MSKYKPVVNLQRQMKRNDYLQGIDSYELEKPIDQLIEYFTILQARYPKHENIRVDVSDSYESVDITLLGDRLETDKEMTARIKSEEAHVKAWERKEKKKLEDKAKKQQEAKKIVTSKKADRKKLYEELKKEFE